jgi:hypothetical protein
MNKYLEKYLKYKRKYKQLQMIGGMPVSAKLFDYRLHTENRSITNKIINNDNIKKFLKKIYDNEHESEQYKNFMTLLNMMGELKTEDIYDFIITYAKRLYVFSCSDDDGDIELFNSIFGIDYEILYYFFIDVVNEGKQFVYIYFINANHTWSYFVIEDSSV